MSLSIIKIGYHKFGLYCSDKKAFVMQDDNRAELEYWKNEIENFQQAQDNRAHLEELKKEYLNLLILGGNTEDEAETFLRSQMNLLYEN